MSSFLLLKRIFLYSFAIAAILAAGSFACYYATLYTAGPAQEGYLALTGATVLTGEDLEPREGTTILIKDGTILKVGEGEDIDIPSEATVLDLSGYTVMPGLIDMHVHIGSPALDPEKESGILTLPKMVFDRIRFFPGTRRAFLEYGVTTVRDLGNEYGWIMELRRQLDEGVLEGPRLLAAGPIFTTSGGHPVVTFGVDPASDMVRLPATPDEARHAVQELAGGEDPVNLIKVVQERGRPPRQLEPIPPDVLCAIVAEAHHYNLPVTAHWGSQEDLEDVLTAGVDGLDHLESRGVQEGWPEEMLYSLVKRNISLTPTLVVTDKVINKEVHQKLRQRVKEFHAAGGRVVVGSDAPIQGVSFGAGVHRELELLVESGFTPQEALKSATSEAAKVLRTARIGSIKTGRAADLVIIDGDPLLEVQAARNVVMVFQDGRLVVDRRNGRN